MIKRFVANFVFAALLSYALTSPKGAYSAPDESFAVTVVTDSADVNPGDGECADNTGECCLRAAIMEANTRAGADSINLPADTFTHTRVGNEEDSTLEGDLDITSELSIKGSGMDNTFIDAAGIDRVFDIRPGAKLTITEVTIRGGIDNIRGGGGLRNFGTLTL